uniref:Legume lectin domain-containing protein n=1 Tax=Kalanchoe fedtschenkoi TaxID=63787 RepID=A0A7N1A0D2_KALFE
MKIYRCNLTNSSTNQTSNVFYSKPFRLLSPNLTAVSFSTTFVFSILTPVCGAAGSHGLAFARSLPITPANPNYLGLFNSANDGNASDHIFAVEFDTAQVSALDRRNAAPRSILPDIDDNHVGIDINGMNTLAATPASYYDDATKTQTDMQLESDKAFQVWIAYDGPIKTVHVTICPLFLRKPSKPLISHQVDLSPIFKPLMFPGFTSATGKLASAHYIQAWSFRLHKPARSPDLTKQRVARPEHDGQARQLRGSPGSTSTARTRARPTWWARSGTSPRSWRKSGRATTSSDVYAFGALVFEVVCGRRPLDSSVPSEVLVQDWVWECYRAGDVSKNKVVDQKLEGEAELALKVGLICSQYEAKARLRDWLDGREKGLQRSLGVSLILLHQGASCPRHHSTRVVDNNIRACVCRLAVLRFPLRGHVDEDTRLY